MGLIASHKLLGTRRLSLRAHGERSVFTATPCTTHRRLLLLIVIVRCLVVLAVILYQGGSLFCVLILLGPGPHHVAIVDIDHVLRLVRIILSIGIRVSLLSFFPFFLLIVLVHD